MPITFNCPCGKILSAPDRDAGMPGVCPDCGRSTIVPLVEKPRENDDSLKPKIIAHNIEDWIFSHQRTIWLASGLVGLLIAAGMVAYFTWLNKGPQSQPPPGAKAAVSQPAAPLEKADPSQWDTNFHSFAEALRQAIASGQKLDDIFGGQPIRWEVTHKYVLEGSSLFFDEAESLLEENHGIRIWAELLPNERGKAQETHRGAKIVLTGKVGTITSQRTAMHPQGATTITIAEAEIRPVDEANR